MTIEPAVLLGLLGSIGTAVGGAITVLFRAIMKAHEDMRTDRDHWRAISEEQSKQISRLTADHERVVTLLERGTPDAPKDFDTHPARRRASA